jgi:hypothetical protein
MGAILDDLWNHEGYGARHLPDGTLTATWSTDSAAFDSYLAACTCGWHGGEHPPTDDGYEAALDEWEADHARPLLAKTVPAAVASAITDAKQAISRLMRDRPEAARRALDELGAWSADTRQRLDPDTTVERIRHKLGALGSSAVGRPDHGRPLGR